MAEKYPDVTSSLWCLYNPAKHPKNVGSYFGLHRRAEYSRVTARSPARQEARVHRGEAHPSVLRNINPTNSGALGESRGSSPCGLHGDWSKPVRSQAPTVSWIRRDVLTPRRFSEGVIETAERRGMFNHRHIRRTRPRSRRGYLTGPSGTAKGVLDVHRQVMKGSPGAPGGGAASRGVHQ